MIPPPAGVVYAVEQASPGFWSEFAWRANGALAGLSGISLTSWWRSDSHNTRVGGVSDSQHLLGTALDIGGPNAQQAGNRLQAYGFTVIRYPTHVHAQAWAPGVAARSGLLAVLRARRQI